MVSSRSLSDVLQVVAIALKFQGKGLFTGNTAGEQRALPLVDAEQASGPQHLACGQVHRLQLATDAAQGVQLL